MLQALGILIALAGLQDPTPLPTLPAEIRSYYDDHNHVVAFSWPSERQRLVSSTHAEDTVSDPRLLDIRERMARVQDRLQLVDPGVVFSESAPEIVRATTVFRIRSEHLDPEGDEVWVDVDLFEIGPQTNALFVAQYREKGKDAPSPLDFATRVSRTLRLAQATHHWRRTGGEWRRELKTQLLIVR